MALIVHVSSAHERTDTRIFMKECRSLAQMGHDVTFLLADGGAAEWREGVRIESAGKRRGRLARMALTPLGLLRRALALEADLYHLHDPELLPMGWVLKAWGSRVVFDAHEDLPKQVLSKPYLPALLRPLVATFAASLQGAVLPWLDGVVSATPAIQASLRPIHPRTLTLHNYPIRGELEAGGPRTAPGPHLCYIGGISRIRGIRELVAAMALVPPGLRLKLAGPFEDAHLIEELKALPGWGQVDCLGTLDRAGVRDLMAHCSVGIVTFLPAPNHVEAQPNKMFEYMSAGLAVVGSDFPLWASLLEEGPCGVCVDPLDPASIAQAIRFLLSPPERALAYGRSGQRAVQERFNWEAEAPALSRFYEALLSPGAAQD